MKILFITHYSTLYGANRSLLLLLKGLKEKNVKVMVIVPKAGPLLIELDKLNIPYRRIRFWAWMGVKNNLFFLKVLFRFFANLVMLPQLLICARSFEPSLIYTNSSITPVGIFLALLLRIPHIWHIRELGKLDYNLDYDFGKKYFSYFMRKSDAIICISNFVKENIFPPGWNNVVVINNAVFSLNDDEPIASSKMKREDSSFIFLMMNIILPSKGIQDAIEALAKLKVEIKNVKLIICGEDEDNEYRNYLNNLVKNLSLEEYVIFKGFVEKPVEMYQNADAVLVCSRNEAWGRVAAEAMYFEKPVIGFKSGGTKEIISNNVNGWLYESIEELVSCMKNVVRDKELVGQIKVKAREFALKNFSNKDYADKIFQIIKSLDKHN